jgi:hypothetical protein
MKGLTFPLKQLQLKLKGRRSAPADSVAEKRQGPLQDWLRGVLSQSLPGEEVFKRFYY